MHSLRGLPSGLVCAVVSIVALLCGCASYTDPITGRESRATDVATIPAESWPIRNRQAASTLASEIEPGQRLTLVRRTIQRRGAELRPIDSPYAATVVSATAIGEGALLDVLPADAAGADAGQTASPRRSLVFISIPGGADGPTAAQRVSGFGERGVHLDIEMPPANQEPVGIVFHLHGLGGKEYERPVIERLLASGFLVVSGDFPWNRWQPMQDSVESLEDVHRVARVLGQLTDDAMAEAAYAAEAAVSHLWAVDRRLTGKPVVALGFSAGSLVMPTVAARLGERCTAMVLVASGCNLVGILQDSELTNGGVELHHTGRRLSGPRAGLVVGCYLQETKLDPYYTALACRRLPTLLVMGDSDTIVPALYGNLLYERLNSPAMLRYSGGHRTVFMALDASARRITDWVDRSCGVEPLARGTKVGSETDQ